MKQHDLIEALGAVCAALAKPLPVGADRAVAADLARAVLPSLAALAEGAE